MIKIEEFTLPEPDNYSEIVNSSDELFADLLIRYFFGRGNTLTGVSDNGKLINKEADNGKLYISQRSVSNF